MPRARACGFALVLSVLAAGAPAGVDAVSALELPGGGASIGGVADYALTCTAGPVSREFHLTVSATAPSVARIGDAVSLQHVVWALELPGATLEAARVAGDVAVGDRVSATVRATIDGAGTLEGTRPLAPGTITMTPLATDASGQLRPVAGSTTLDGASWTAAGGSVAFRPGPATVDVALGRTVASYQCVANGSHAILTTAVLGRSTGVSNEVVRTEIRVPLLEPGAPVPETTPPLVPEASVEGTVTVRPATGPGDAIRAGGAEAAAGAGSPLARTGLGPAGRAAAFVALALIELGYLLTAAGRRRRPPRATRTGT